MGCVAAASLALGSQARAAFTAATLAWLWSTRRHAGVKENF